MGWVKPLATRGHTFTGVFIPSRYMLKGLTLPRISRLAVSLATPTVEAGPYIFIFSFLAKSSEIISPQRFPESIKTRVITALL
jgi:hypothetical protein